jgi:cytochrome b561
MVEKTLVKATRIAAGDDAAATGGRYDVAAITLHWLTALLVVTLFVLAEIWGFLQHGSTARHTLQWLHVSLGIALMGVVAVRMVWHGVSDRRLPRAETGPLEWAARAMHYILYLLLVTMILAGFVKVWSQGHAANFFGLFAVPPPFPIAESWRPIANTVHYWGAWTIIVLAGLHSLAALFHHCALHDDVLRRMLPSSRPIKAH